MKIWKARKIRTALLVGMGIFLLLGWIVSKAAPTLSFVFFVIGFGLLLADLAIYILFYHCPSCGRGLGLHPRHMWAEYCPHCGEYLE